jgi:Dyp-type peroxidase family
VTLPPPQPQWTQAITIPGRRWRGASAYPPCRRTPHGTPAYSRANRSPETAAAIVSGQGAGLDGSSFVAVQRYVHDHAGFARLTPEARDHAMGRRASDNEEIADAPASAHVKRTAQESFEPTAFMVRRSMPWGGVAEHGLYFVAYGESLDRFERMLTRMAGIEAITGARPSATVATTGRRSACERQVGTLRGRRQLRRLNRMRAAERWHRRNWVGNGELLSVQQRGQALSNFLQVVAQPRLLPALP